MAMIEDDATAYRVAAIPTEYSDLRINQVFTRGFDHWTVDGDERPDRLAASLERFGTAVLETAEVTSLSLPALEGPASLTVVTTLTAIRILDAELFADARPRTVQPFATIRDSYGAAIVDLVRARDTESLYQDLAEVLYAKPYGKDPYQRRICTGVVEDRSGADRHLEIPLTSGSRACLIEDDDGLCTQVANNCLYVPLEDLFEKYHRYCGEAFERLVAVHRDGLSSEQREWLVDATGAIGHQLDRLESAGRDEMLWTYRERGDQLVDVLGAAIRAAPDDTFELGTPLPVERLYGALSEFDPDERWQEQVTSRVQSPTSLASELTSLEDHPRITVHDQGTDPHYAIGHGGNGSRQLRVNEIEDLFALPCMAAMDDRLQEEGPVRKDLWNFVRTVLWLPEYRDVSLESLTADLKAVFERWPWYDPRETEYQVAYEYRNRIDGEEPLPMHCDNDDMQRYCIGKAECPYSIYGSLPFPDELYDRLEGGDRRLDRGGD